VVYQKDFGKKANNCGFRYVLGEALYRDIVVKINQLLQLGAMIYGY
jgi:hypothetical protein